MNGGIAFVTGGSGFLGSNLIKYLRSHDYQVRALARSQKAAEVIESQGIHIENEVVTQL